MRDDECVHRRLRLDWRWRFSIEADTYLAGQSLQSLLDSFSRLFINCNVQTCRRNKVVELKEMGKRAFGRLGAITAFVPSAASVAENSTRLSGSQLAPHDTTLLPLHVFLHCALLRRLPT